MLQWKSSSSCIEQGISWFFSSCGGKLGIHLELRQGPQGTSPVASGKSSLLSSCERENGIAPESQQGNHASTRLSGKSCGGALGCSGFLLICDVDVREPLTLLQGSEASFQVARGTSGFLSSHCRRIRPHLKLRWETQGSAPVAKGVLGFLSSFSTGESGLVSCWGMKLCFLLEL